MKKDSFAKKLAAYVAMSSAFLAAQKECDAQIVYTNVEPDSLIGNVAGQSENFYLDLNGDGIEDFNIIHSDLSSNYIIALGSNSIANGIFAIGDTISSGLSWNSYGLPNNSTNQFLGLKLKKDGQDYFGWVRLGMVGAEMIIRDYGFNVIAEDTTVIEISPCNSSQPSPIILLNGTELQSTGSGIAQWHFFGDTLSGYNANNISPPAVGFYKVIYQDTSGCFAQSLPFFYMDCDSFVAYITPAIDSICQGYSTTLISNYNNASSDFIFQWQKDSVNIPGAHFGVLHINNVTADNFYRVIISNQSYSCVDTSENFQVPYFPNPIPTITIHFDLINHIDTLFSSPGTTYQWSGSSGGNISGATNQYFIPVSNNFYKVQVTYSNGCMSNSDYTIWNTCSYLAGIGILNLGSFEYCYGTSFYDSLMVVNYFPNYNYEWYRNWVVIPFADSAILYPNDFGNYNLVITDTVTGCVRNTNTITLSSLNLPVPFIIQSNDTFFTQTSMNNYQWYFNSQPISGANNWFYIVSQQGNYSVSFTNSNDCYGISSDYNFSTCTIGNPEIQFTNDTTFCQGESTTLQVGFNFNYTYQWLNGTTNIAGANNNYLITDSTGNYSVLITDTVANCTYQTQTITITVFPYTPAFIYQSGDSLFSTLSGLSYEWYHNSLYLTGSNHLFYPLPLTPSGSYYVIVYDSSGCPVVSPTIYFVQNGIQNINTNEYELFTEGETISLNIKDESIINGKISIYNLLGQLIYSDELKNKTLLLNLKEATGMNFIVIRKDEFYRIEKIILN